MKSADLRDRLQEELLIFDGGIGTEIYRHNYFINSSFEQLSLTAPQVISGIHREYAEAGAQVLTTNTFNANRRKLSQFGLGDQTGTINAAGVRLAREAAGEEKLVAGALGPIGADVAHEEAAAMLAEQGAFLLEAGADFLIFESLAGERELRDASAAVCALAETFPEVAYIFSFSLDDAGKALDGTRFEDLQKLLPANPAPAALGLNCGRGPEITLGAVEYVVPRTTLPVVVQPNAGEPRRVDNRTIYLTSPEYFTTYTLRYVNCGARGVGGCCGITPTHIKDMARSVKPFSRGESQSGKVFAAISEDAPMRDTVPLAQRSKLGAKLAAGEWIKSVEITPPPGFDLTSTIEKAITCREAGIDVINLPDGPRASARISSVIAAIEIEQKAKIETMLHLCCRDRSMIGLQSTLLGCAAMKLHNILFITGDPPKLGNFQNSSGVFDVDAIGLARMASLMNRGLDMSGKELPEQTATVIAVGADPNAIDLEREYRRICEKAEAGAELIVTQPVFSIKPLFDFMKRIEHLRLPLLAGVWPLASYRNAEFMRNEVPGVVVPDEIMVRMAQATGREEQRAVGIAIARETVAALRNHVQGIQVSAPFGNVQTAIAVHEE